MSAELHGAVVFDDTVAQPLPAVRQGPLSELATELLARPITDFSPLIVFLVADKALNEVVDVDQLLRHASRSEVQAYNSGRYNDAENLYKAGLHLFEHLKALDPDWISRHAIYWPVGGGA